MIAEALQYCLKGESAFFSQQDDDEPEDDPPLPHLEEEETVQPTRADNTTPSPQKLGVDGFLDTCHISL